MSINLSIPLSGQFPNILGFYVEPFNGSIKDDISHDWRLIGYVSGGYRTGIDPASYKPERLYITSLDIPIPVYKNSLLSASFYFKLNAEIPPVNFDPLFNTGIFDWRTDINRDFSGSSNIPIEVCAQSGFYSKITNYNNIKNSPKTTPSKYTVSAGPYYSINLTDHIKHHSNKPSWNKNDNIVFFLSGTPSGVGVGGAIDLTSLYLNLSFSPVTPFKPTNLIVSETAYRQATISWSGPLDDGGSAVTSYQVQYGILSGSINYVQQWTTAGTTSNNTFSIDNLLFDTNYVFRVAARNSVGLGEYSSQTIPFTVSRNNSPVTSLNFNDANYTRIRLRRATPSEWSGINPILALGEAGYELVTRKIKIGDGVSAWNALGYTTVDNSSINFPPPPDTNLIIASSRDNLPGNDRIILNLSSGERLNVVGEEGIKVLYNDSYQRLIITADKLYNPINSGTLMNPTNSGTPGSLLYDDNWLYFCIKENFWNRVPIDKSWLDIASLTISNTGGSYGSTTSMIFDKNLVRITTDGDPYPALAGRPLINNGSGIRSGFGQQSIIREQNLSLLYTYRGGTNSHSPMPINHTDIHGIMNNGVVVMSVSAGSGALPGFIEPPSGFTFNAVSNSVFYGVDDCGGYPDVNGLYRYRDGRFLKNCWNTNKVYLSNNYYSSTNYNGDYFRHSDGHSKIIGFCLDGYPIYGPYAYSQPDNPTSGISLMTSSYSGISLDNHRPINWKYWNTITVGDIRYSIPMGTFIEDYIYSSGYGSLDEFNGRFGITPDFPSGTYAYYLTFADNDLLIPSYPYIFGNSTKQQRPSYSV